MNGVVNEAIKKVQKEHPNRTVAAVYSIGKGLLLLEAPDKRLMLDDYSDPYYIYVPSKKVILPFNPNDNMDAFSNALKHPIDF